MRTKIVSAFPGTGKTYYTEQANDPGVWDSDSSVFSWSEPGIRHPDFPQNYIDHIKEGIGKCTIIFVSSHKVVRDALCKNGIHFDLVYPERDLKDEYIGRFKERGSPDKFVEFIDSNWDDFIDELDGQRSCDKIRLFTGEYIAHVRFHSMTGSTFVMREG